MKKYGKYLLAVVVALFVAGGAFAQTTGTVEGVVNDENNAPLPGVTAEATSPNLQGTKVSVTDTFGKFRFVLLPPGTYSVKFTLQGFATTEQSGIAVGLGRTVSLVVTMHTAFKEEVVVSGAAPTIDTKSTEIGTNLSAQQISNLALGRNYVNLVQVAPGTGTDATGATVYGSTGAENAYYIDGMDTTDVKYGQQGKNLNMEFIQEMQVKTGGYQAEFGRSTGALINVITKSGGNEYHGDVFGYYDPSSWQNNVSKEVTEGAALLNRSFLQKDYKRQDYGLDIGGYFVKDKLWFFGAYDYVKNDVTDKVAQDFQQYVTDYPGIQLDYGFPTAGATFPDNTKSQLWSGKLTYRASENHTLSFSGFGDPQKEEGFVGPTLAGNDATITGTLDTGGTDMTLKYAGVLGSSLVINASAGQHKQKDIYGGTGFNSVAMLDYASPVYLETGVIPTWDGWGYAFSDRFEREQYKADLSYYVNNFGGDHEFKFGVEQEHIKIKNIAYNSGGQRIYRFCSGGYNADDSCKGTIYYRHRYYMTMRPPNDDPLLVDSSYLLNGLAIDTKNDNYAVYAQDTWRVSSNITLNLGVRWERQKMYDKFGGVAADLKKNWAPRIGFVWDPRNDGTSKVYGSWGYFYETIPADMITRSFGGEIDAFMYNLHGAENDPNRYDITCDPFVNSNIRSCSMPGAEATPVDPNLKGQYISEAILGTEWEVMKDWVVGGKFIYRNLERVIEDALAAGATTYFIGNPGEGIQKQDYDINYGGPYTVPKAKRRFVGFEVDFRKRFSNNWQLIGSYLWSHLYGNYDGTFQASTGQLDPNINSAYDYYDFEVHNNGDLSNDRRHQVKVDASYTFDFGLTGGLSAYWRSGTPITAMGYSAAYQNWEFYLSDRGAFGTTPSQYEADLHLGYPLKVSGIEINFLLDIFNLMNRQGITTVSQRYDSDEIFDVINYTSDGSPGTVVPAIPGGTSCLSTPEGQADPTLCNPGFGKASAWQAPRSIRLGIRLTF
jgi:outer membrane receptor protein involved in Fe transport